MATKRNLKLVVIEGLISNLLLGVLFVWSILRNPFLELFPTWNEGMLSIIFGFHNLFVCGGILISGPLSKKISTRKLYFVFLLSILIGLGGFAFIPVNSPSVAYVMAMILFWFAAFGSGIGISIVQSSTIPWFPNKSGAISGALYMALGISSVILAAFGRIILPKLGVKYILPIFAVGIFIIGIIVLLDKQSITPPVVESVTVEGEIGFTPKEMLKSPVFWLILFWSMCIRTSGLTLLDHTASIAEAFGGAAIVAMLIAPANGLGSLTVGFAFDKFGMKKILRIDACIFLFAGILLIIGVFTNNFVLILPGLLLGGFAYGGQSSSYVASIKKQFGTKHYSQNFALGNIVIGFAAFLESTTGTIVDKTGGYNILMILLTCITGIALILSIFAGRKTKD